MIVPTHFSFSIRNHCWTRGLINSAARLVLVKQMPERHTRSAILSRQHTGWSLGGFQRQYWKNATTRRGLNARQAKTIDIDHSSPMPTHPSPWHLISPPSLPSNSHWPEGVVNRPKANHKGGWKMKELRMWKWDQRASSHRPFAHNHEPPKIIQYVLYIYIYIIYS